MAMNGQVIDTRLLGKVQNFRGDEASWQDWSFQFQNYAGAVRPDYPNFLDFASAEDREITEDRLTPEAAEAAHQLHYMLALQCAEAALGIVKLVQAKNGPEAWRRKAL